MLPLEAPLVWLSPLVEIESSDSDAAPFGFGLVLSCFGIGLVLLIPPGSPGAIGKASPIPWLKP